MATVNLSEAVHPMPINQLKLNGAFWTIAYIVGALIVGLAVTVALTQISLSELLTWLQQVFSVGFIAMYLALVGVAGFAIYRIREALHATFWFEAGVQAANGIATTALTFTLLGISLGIGSLAEQSLTPETVQSVIQSLTSHFATAFMTTVVGLPTASALRAALALMQARNMQPKIEES